MALASTRLKPWKTCAVASEIAIALIGGGAGLVTGTIGSLFAPWSQWGVEKQRLRREGRLGKLIEWRSGIAELDQKGADFAALWELEPPPAGRVPTNLIKAELDLRRALELDRLSWFQSLSNHLEPGLREQLREPQKNIVRPGSDGTPRFYGPDELAGVVASKLAAEVARIELEWNLL
jgi:hypothetical protein